MEEEVKAYLSENQRNQIKDFLLGLAFMWKKDHGTAWFTLQNILGGSNFDWDDTPPMNLYKMYKIRFSFDDAPEQEKASINVRCIKAAGKFAGRLLREIMEEKKSLFESSHNGYRRCYRFK